MGRKQWRCFHCDEVFTSRRWAAEHFGIDQSAEPACKLSSGDEHILTAYRKLEDQLNQFRAEDTDLHRAVYAYSADSAAAIRTAEEKGYERGVRDMKAQGMCIEPQAHV